MLRDATPADAAAILALNADWVEFLSPMDASQLAAFAAAACYLRVAEEGGAVAAFLLGFRKHDAYGGVNFAWFAAHLDDFFYIDRVVVAPAFRGQGLADRLYDDFEAAARAAGIGRLACEVNVEPPNPVSLRFHARRGFREIGRLGHLPGKIVAMLVRDLA